jgi:hypothetical protein
MHNRDFARFRRRLGVICGAFLCLILAGCAGATRLPTRSRGPNGNQIAAKQIDLAFVQTGTTKRQEVLDKLYPVNTGCCGPRLFWGRWTDSKWGYWWLVVAPGGSSGSGAGNAKRLWRVKSIVLSFDDNEVVQSMKVFDEDRSLWRELHSHLPDLDPLDLTQLFSIPVGRRGEGVLTLGKDFIEVERRKKSTARIPPANVQRISHEGTPEKGDNPGLTCHTLHFAKRTDVGRTLHFCAQGSQVMTLFQYLQQAGPKDIEWE